MILLKWQSESEPAYQTSLSAGADLKAKEQTLLPPGKVVKVPTGVWIERVEWEKVPAGAVPELQVRARSSLAFKHGITLANSVGTIDADFPDEFQVLLWNFSQIPYEIAKGERIAQIILSLSYRLPQLVVHGKRLGGFGSTGRGFLGGTSCAVSSKPPPCPREEPPPC